MVIGHGSGWVGRGYRGGRGRPWFIVGVGDGFLGSPYSGEGPGHPVLFVFGSVALKQWRRPGAVGLLLG